MRKVFCEGFNKTQIFAVVTRRHMRRDTVDSDVDGTSEEKRACRWQLPFQKQFSNPGFVAPTMTLRSIFTPLVHLSSNTNRYTQPVSHAHRCISRWLRLSDTPIDESHAMSRRLELLISAAGRYSCTNVGNRPEARWYGCASVCVVRLNDVYGASYPIKCLGIQASFV
jgi:hypothetical protein